MSQKIFAYPAGVKISFLVLFTCISFFSSFSQNAIVTENLKPGSPASAWDIPDGTAGDLTLQGFATDISVNVGQTINFKVDVNAGTKSINISIYRLGFYQGNGARLIQSLGPFTGVSQTVAGHACVYDATTGQTDCGTWTTLASWAVPSTAVSGYYIAKLSRADGTGGVSHIAFIVRNDASTSNLYFKASDATWQAYNPYGGNSLYVGAGLPTNHADKVSYNRPFLTRSGGGGGNPEEDWLFNSEYPMIRFLEGNGYDISYTTDLDVVRNNLNNVNLILNHKVFLSVGHDEYWSKEERNSVEAAKAAGIHLAFFSGNEVYWKTRWENSIDGSNTPMRSMVCYKEGTDPSAELVCGGKCDPSIEWTGLWRFGCDAPGGNACKPENALSGEISWDGNSGTMEVPDTYKNLRFWRNTPVASLPAGGIADMTPNTLGYEWDWEQFQSSYPNGRVTMSNTSLDGHVHKLSLYKASSGAIVFGAGTVQWAWGLDSHHDRGSDPANISMQQATINLLADMGVQPDPTATLETGLSRATSTNDVTPPVSIITAPTNGTSIPQNNVYTITGTATDVGGVVAGVDVSVDGGLTWQAANGTNSWTFTWTPTTLGTVTIMSRAFDDIGNIEVPGGSEGSANVVNAVVVVGTPPNNCPCSIFTPTQTPPTSDEALDLTPVTLGVKFRPAFDGNITAVRFYLAPDDHATDHTVQIWTLNGTLLETVAATISGSGWQEIALPTQIPVTANTTYVASYYCSSGIYNNTNNTFTTPVVNGPLTAIADGDADGPNGVYQYGATTPNFPTQSYMATNYWVDVEFIPNGSGPDITPPTILAKSPTAGATTVNVNTFVSITFSENIDPTTVNTNTIQLTDPSNTVVDATVNYSSGARTATLIPNASLSYSTTYTVTAKGGTTDPRIKDLAGNALANDPSNTWTFTTGAPPAVPPDDGAGGPLLVISSTLNPFSRYMVEILRAQGYTAFKAIDITEIGSVNLSDYDVILLGNMTLNSSQVTTLTAWVTAGGTLIAQRPTGLLLPLMGVTAGAPLSDAYLQVNTTAGLPGAGIVTVPIQYHGAADEYTIIGGTGATSLGTLFSTISTGTTFPAITTRTVGTGAAIAFSYDLAKSIIYTRQGNPLLVGQSLDGESGPRRSDNLFFNGWLDFTNVSIPQADEQQHLLTNILLLSNLHKKPLPHLWFLPNQFKAAVVMTGDDHNINYGSTETRFNEYMTLAPNTSTDVTNWTAIRGTSYIYNNTPIPTAPVDSVAFFQNNGFEIALHPTTNCVDFTPASLGSDLSSQLSAIRAQYPELISPVTNRTHCLPWSDWSSQPQIENSLGIRFDVNYYYWPDTWVQNRPGMFTGSGMPMRFSDLDGNIIDCYQAPTQITDESGQDIPTNISTLLDNAINKGYYGAFVMNMHTDFGIHPGSDAITTAALSRGIPVVSAKQMLTWLDSRNSTAFSSMTWDGSHLDFHLSTTAINLQTMVPVNSAGGSLLTVTAGGANVPFTIQTVKGIPYGFFPATTNDYVATYSSTPLPILLLNFTATKEGDDAQLNWATSMESNNKGFEIQRSTDNSTWTVLGFVAGAGNSQTERDYQYVDKNLQPGTYYYRLRQVDNDGHSTLSEIRVVSFGGELTLELKQNRPNPFNTSTTIDIVIPKGGQVQLMLYDEMGRPVQQLLNQYEAPGTFSIQVNRNGLSSGNYYYKMNALGQSIVRKMAIL